MDFHSKRSGRAGNAAPRGPVFGWLHDCAQRCLRVHAERSDQRTPWRAPSWSRRSLRARSRTSARDCPARPPSLAARAARSGRRLCRRGVELRSLKKRQRLAGPARRKPRSFSAPCCICVATSPATDRYRGPTSTSIDRAGHNRRMGVTAPLRRYATDERQLCTPGTARRPWKDAAAQEPPSPYAQRS